MLIRRTKNKKLKLEILVKQLCDDADTLLTDAEKKKKMTFFMKANSLREKENKKSKEVDVISHDIEAGERKLKNI